MSDSTRTTIIVENDLYDRLKRSAKASRRSVHAQILTYVEVGLDRDDEVEQAALASPEVMAAIRHAREGDRSELRRRELRPWPEEASPE
jgi:acetoin utilization deacetylase AcuC-like enzyme